MPRFTTQLSPEAHNDLANIAEFTLENWGEHQLIKYRVVLEKAFAEITRDPLSPRTKARDEFFAGGRSIHAGRHFIVYRIKGSVVQVIRILHDSMELERHLPQAFQDTL